MARCGGIQCCSVMGCVAICCGMEWGVVELCSVVWCGAVW